MANYIGPIGLNYLWGKMKSLVSGKANTADLAKVATSGSYNDLSNKPTIPAAVTESTVSGWGFTKNAGTITGVTMNGVSKGTSGVVDLGTVITSHQDISGKANTADLAAVATSGSYTDLVGAPQYVICTLAQYNAMASHDSDTYYIII